MFVGIHVVDHPYIVLRGCVSSIQPLPTSRRVLYHATGPTKRQIPNGFVHEFVPLRS